jgi:N-methylhydantoinase A/oxoprolinase/acetone carboxylase beta subunit
MLRIGVDIGGMFTNFTLHEGAGAKLAIHQQLTTLADPALAVIRANAIQPS